MKQTAPAGMQANEADSPGRQAGMLANAVGSLGRQACWQMQLAAEAGM